MSNVQSDLLNFRKSVHKKVDQWLSFYGTPQEMFFTHKWDIRARRADLITPEPQVPPDPWEIQSPPQYPEEVQQRYLLEPILTAASLDKIVDIIDDGGSLSLVHPEDFFYTYIVAEKYLHQWASLVDNNRISIQQIPLVDILKIERFCDLIASLRPDVLETENTVTDTAADMTLFMLTGDINKKQTKHTTRKRVFNENATAMSTALTNTFANLWSDV